MIRRLLLGAVLLVVLAAPVSAQLFGGIVYDPDQLQQRRPALRASCSSNSRSS